MYEGLSSPNIHTPRNLQEYSSIILHYPSSSFWAGGTYIMSRPDAYPSNSLNQEIIYLGGIEELHRFQRNDRFAEFGAMVTLDEIISTGKTVLPKVLIDNIENIGSRLITRRATIGGALASKDVITSFPGTLIVLDANVEIKFIKKKRLHSKWMQLTRLLDRNGHLVLPPQGMISRVRIAFTDKNYQNFSSVGSFMTKGDDAVSVAFATTLNQDVLMNPTIAFTYPKLGILYSRDVDNVFSSLRFPLDDKEYKSLEMILFTFIDSTFQNLSDLQRVRTKGILRNIVDDLNEKALTIPQYGES